LEAAPRKGSAGSSAIWAGERRAKLVASRSAERVLLAIGILFKDSEAGGSGLLAETRFNHAVADQADPNGGNLGPKIKSHQAGRTEHEHENKSSPQQDDPPDEPARAGTPGGGDMSGPQRRSAARAAR
jgi:hypothetical protein